MDRGVNRVVFDRSQYLDPGLLESACQPASTGVEIKSDDGNGSALRFCGFSRKEVVSHLARDPRVRPRRWSLAVGSIAVLPS